MIIIVDYGLGNLGSIKNMLRKIGFASEISSDIKTIASASKIILPGVGAFDTGMSRLMDLDLVPLLNKKVIEEKTPVLGICLGAQLMCRKSEEGSLAGLGWFDAEVLAFKGRFDTGKELPVPNMGWIDVGLHSKSLLTENLPENSRFYFVHSFFIKANKKEDILMTSDYGFTYDSALHKGNIFAVQYHPEKSHKYGFQLLKNFASI
jgi:imidazole glycerol-phosphate synthase subunit HisH